VTGRFGAAGAGAQFESERAASVLLGLAGVCAAITCILHEAGPAPVQAQPKAEYVDPSPIGPASRCRTMRCRLIIKRVQVMTTGWRLCSRLIALESPLV
jgi:hypothetical protein